MYQTILFDLVGQLLDVFQLDLLEHHDRRIGTRSKVRMIFLF